MSYKYILLASFLMSIFVTSYGQISDEQKIQQLQEAWLQKAQELSVLGEKIAQKYRLKKEIFYDIHEYWDSLSAKLEGQEKEDFKQAMYSLMMEKFAPKFTQLFCEEVNVKGFIMKEFFNVKGNYSGFNMANFGLFRLDLESELLIKLVEQYEKCLQEFAEIDHELVVLLERPSVFA